MQNFVIKERTFQDTETGEVLKLEEIYKLAYGTKPFWKLYLSDFLGILGIVMESRQLDVLIHILEKTDPTKNLFIGTLTSIAKDVRVALSTVQLIMKKLQTSEYKGQPMLRKVQSGVYMVSPHLLLKGGSSKQKSLLITWKQLGEKTIEDFIDEGNMDFKIEKK